MRFNAHTHEIFFMQILLFYYERKLKLAFLQSVLNFHLTTKA